MKLKVLPSPLSKAPRLSNPRHWPLLLACVSCVAALPASAATLSFTRVTSNSPVDYSTSISAEIMEFGTDVLLTVTMADAPPAGFINQLYIQDTAGLFSGVSFSSALSSGDLTAISYSAPATPGHPPGAAGFITAFSLDSDSPAASLGINNGETGAFLVSWSLGMTALQAEQALLDGSLQIAVHAQGLDPNGVESDTFISMPPGDPRITNDDPPIPEPSALLLGIFGLAITVLRRR